MTRFPKRELERPAGFPDLSVEQAVAIRNATAIIREEYELAGFSPLTTSIIERPSVLTAKNDGEILTQIYALRLLNPPEGAADDSKELALRFDHTVPLARYVAKLYSELQFPFRRYAIGPVFRGERPRDGRYRQFTQADIDIIGDGSLDLLHDAEMVAVIVRVFTRLNIGDFTVRIGHRKVLQGLLETIGLQSTDEQKHALQEIDRLEKIGHAKVVKHLEELGLTDGSAERLLDLLKTDNLELLQELSGATPLLVKGIDELREVFLGINAFIVDQRRYMLDLSIARGLAYYTGTVYETRLDSHPKLGSIASGGRYENLAASFTDRFLPGVGISIGVTRVMKRLIQAGIYPSDLKTVASVLVAQATQSEGTRLQALRIAALLREAGIATEVYIEPARLKKQLQFADRRAFKTMVILGVPGVGEGLVLVRDIATGDEQVVSVDTLVEFLKK